MPEGPLLPLDDLREVCTATIAAGLSRTELLAPIDRRLVARFKTASALAAQLWIDLCALNDVRDPIGGTIPLVEWLKTAVLLAEPHPQTEVFRKALRALGVDPPAPIAPGAPAAKSPTTSTNPSPTPTETPMDFADILIVTILPEEYAAVIAQLSNARPAQGTPEEPQQYGWRIGEIAQAGATAFYRVAVALVGGGGNVKASQAVTASVLRWHPRYVVLVGIAGGLEQDGCQVGDVVVSTEIFGYDYGKVDDGFKPRPNWIHQVDVALLASAQAFSAIQPDWSKGLVEQRPKVLFGPVAAGDKVVDDPSDPLFKAALLVWPKLQAVEMESAGAAGAIEYLRSASKVVGLLTVRGISDMPCPPEKRPERASQKQQRDTHKRRACDAAAHFVTRWIAAEWPAAPSAANPPPSRSA